jgi:hypothetical protein
MMMNDPFVLHGIFSLVFALLVQRYGGEHTLRFVFKTGKMDKSHGISRVITYLPMID